MRKRSFVLLAVLAGLLPLLSSAQKVRVTVDTTLAGFHLAVDEDSIRFYGLRGAPELKLSRPAMYAVMEKHGLPYELALALTDGGIENAVEEGYVKTGLKVRDTTIGGVRFHDTLLSEKDKKTGKPGYLLFGLCWQEGRAVIFIGADLVGEGRYIDRIRRTFLALRF